MASYDIAKFSSSWLVQSSLGELKLALTLIIFTCAPPAHLGLAQVCGVPAVGVRLLAMT